MSRCLPITTLTLMVALLPLGAFGQSLSELRRDAVRAAAERVRQNVVQVQPIGGGDPLGGDGASKPTTGLVVSSDGLVFTSSYGLEPRPSAFLVTDDSGRRVTGRLLAIDHNRGVALLKTAPLEDPPPVLTAAESPIVGETAIAVGRTFSKETTNLAVGIVSAVNRLHGRAVQTDAAVSPANYGGPLINLRGEVIGLLAPIGPSTGAESRASDEGVGWYDSGIGFAVPLDAIRERLDRLTRGEDIRRGLAGWSFSEGSPYSTAPTLHEVHPGGPASLAGMQAGDVLTAVNGTRVSTQNEYDLVAHSLDDGQTLSVTVLRDGKELSAELILVAELKPYRRPYLGIAVTNASSEEGVAIDRVFAGGPAVSAGVAAGDVLTKLNGAAVSDRQSLLKELGRLAPGDVVRLGLMRGGQAMEIDFAAAELRFDAAGSLARDAEVDKQELIVQGATRRCEVVSPKSGAGARPTLIWVGGDYPDGVTAESLAAAGCVVVVPEAAGDRVVPQEEMSYLADLLPVVRARQDFEPTRLVVGGGGRSAQVALAAAFNKRLGFTGVVVNNWTGRTPRLPGSSPGLRLGALITSSGGRDQQLAESFADSGHPVQSPVKGASDTDPAAWAHGLDRL